MTAGIVTANKSAQKLSKINELAKQAADELGFVLLSVRMGQQGRSNSLEIAIYRKDQAISFSDCEQMSRTLEHLIENEEGSKSETIAGSYLLEVVSPGTDRQLTSAFEFNLFAGKQVRIVAKEKITSVGIDFVAILVGGDENSVIVSHATAPPAKGTAKSTKAKLKTTGRNDSASPEVDSKLTISLQQIYRIYLWTGS